MNPTELHLQVLLEDETRAGFSLWSEGRQEVVPCAKPISMKRQLWHVAAGVEFAYLNADEPKKKKMIVDWFILF